MDKKSQADVAYDYIKNGIISKQFFPGNRLIEEDIVRDTGVSRTSVRTALGRLHYEGVVEGSPNRGMLVTRYSLADIKSAFNVRQILETGAFELAIHNITPDAIDRMRQYNEAIRQLMDNFSISEYVKYNRAFHWEIAKASDNRYYEKYLDEVYNTIAVCLLFYNNAVDDRRSLKFHEDIINALIYKDLDGGKRAIISDNNCAAEDSNFIGVF